MDDLVLLYIDNCQQAHSDILLFVSRCSLKKWKHRARAIRTHIIQNTPRIMIHGLHLYAGSPDPDSAKYLREAIKELPNDTDTYWRGIFDYYKQKLAECGVPKQDPELVAAHQRYLKGEQDRIGRDADRRWSLLQLRAAMAALSVYAH